VEGATHRLVAGLRGRAPQGAPLGQAQALLYRAFEEPGEQRRVQLAKDALAVCPDCADAYVLLAEHARSRKEALRLCGQGVAAGERLDREVFRVPLEHHGSSIIDSCFPFSCQFFRPISLKKPLQDLKQGVPKGAVEFSGNPEVPVFRTQVVQKQSGRGATKAMTGFDDAQLHR
jgi:hypothetical protein